MMNCPHCKTMIDEHEANRCLDAWVAETVMDYKKRVFAGQDNNSLWDDEYIFGIMEDAGFTHKLPEGNAVPVPHYSTDIAAAWEVVGQMENTQINGHVGPTFLHRLRRCSPGRRWGVVWCTDFGYTDEVMGPTAQLAICRAALKAVREPA